MALTQHQSNIGTIGQEEISSFSLLRGDVVELRMVRTYPSTPLEIQVYWSIDKEADAARVFVFPWTDSSLGRSPNSR